MQLYNFIDEDGFAENSSVFNHFLFLLKDLAKFKDVIFANLYWLKVIPIELKLDYLTILEFIQHFFTKAISTIST
jgi:hypothetical protein